jgi:hypothetical protein
MVCSYWALRLASSILHRLCSPRQAGLLPFRHLKLIMREKLR